MRRRRVIFIRLAGAFEPCFRLRVCGGSRLRGDCRNCGRAGLFRLRNARRQGLRPSRTRGIGIRKRRRQRRPRFLGNRAARRELAECVGYFGIYRGWGRGRGGANAAVDRTLSSCTCCRLARRPRVASLDFFDCPLCGHGAPHQPHVPLLSDPLDARIAHLGRSPHQHFHQALGLAARRWQPRTA